ncbi:MAG: hypothetical protein AB7O44_31490 [Hyphomicrobiaceae bacterium]
MATQKQIAANKRNAKSSTGPRTELGRARSRYNALSHGLTAKVALIKGEDPAEFDSFYLSLREAIQPGTIVEDALVERLATVLWRMKRIPILEAAYWDLLAFEQRYIDGRQQQSELERLLEIEWLLAEHQTTHQSRSERIYHYPERTDVEDESGQVRRSEMLCATRALLRNSHYPDVLEKLGKYERHLMRQFEATQRELERLTAKRTEDTN